MASELESAKSAAAGGAAKAAGQWFAVVRDRVNFSAVDERAKKPVRLLVGGSGALELMAALDPSGTKRGRVLERIESAAGWLALDSSTTALLYYASEIGEDSDLARFAALSVPVFVVERTPLVDDLGASASTAAPAARPKAGAPATYRVASFDPIELRKYLLPDVVHASRHREVALAAALPIFRPVVAAKLTIDCAMNSLKIAGLSAIADHVPVIGLITGGIASAGDTIAITVLQMNMLMNLAAAYGKPAGVARIVELLPVIGGGYGWRALARELSGFIPGVGIFVKAAIAYAGTLVVGHAAAHYYETGTPMAPDKMAALYREASERAKHVASDVTSRIRKKS